jgi:acetoin utilization protein AcuB
MRVRDVMKAPVKTVQRTESMGTALEMMQRYGIRHLPVLSNGKLVGVLSDRDLRSPVIPGRWQAVPWGDSIAVEWVMSSPVIVLAPDAPIDEAARLMRAERIDCIPVVDDVQLVGIVTSSDLLDVLGKQEQAKAS